MKQFYTFVCLAVLLSATIGILHGQTTFASITGAVVDASGAVVPNATVTATNTGTNIKTTVKSNEAGNYTIAQLNQGTYNVRAEAAGFKSYVAEGVRLVARDVRRVDVKLELGDIATTVEVKGGATLIETDGVDNTQTGPLANYIESFQEVQIDLSNNSAQFGSIGQVTIISKSGTNELHGTIFDYYSTPWFRAKGYFDSARATGIRHAPGGGIGGPVWLPKIYNGKNRTFFYYSYETARGSSAQDRIYPTVAPSTWRGGNFSANGGPIADPTTGQPFANNVIPTPRLNATSLKIQEMFFPQPNFGDLTTLHTQNYRELRIRPYDPSTYWTSRIDHKLSDRDQVFGRYTWSRLYSRPWEGNLPTIGRRWQQRDDRAATISYTHTFRPTVINEFRWGFGLNNNPINFDFAKGSTQHGKQLVSALGLVGLASNLPDINGILNMSFNNGMTGLYQYPWRAKGYRTHTEELQDHVSGTTSAPMATSSATSASPTASPVMRMPISCSVIPPPPRARFLRSRYPAAAGPTTFTHWTISASTPNSP
ncbi:MAG: carboxypeptidase-like regulatory domain-containing protein [Acidobacteria bacterium]|nr:carboxypeptidase-like regulatory domain-containing protein [Acidobacteriota bacterium]